MPRSSAAIFMAGGPVRLWTDDGSPVRDTIDAIGHVPLPPHQARGRDEAIAIAIKPSTRASADRSRRRPPVCISRRRSSRRSTRQGVERASVTLHVGYGTFQPIRVDSVDEHEMEAEHYEVSPTRPPLLSNAKKKAGASLRSAQPPRARSSRCRCPGRRRCRQAQGDRALHSSRSRSSSSSRA